MPIRTYRGRAAVYRRVWGWPMRSPRHLAATLLVLAVLVATFGIAAPKLFGGSDGGDAGVAAATNEWSTRSRGSPAGPGELATETSTSLPTRLTEPLVTPSPVEPDPAALTIAEQWAAAWVDHPEGITTEEWLDGLEPYTTREFLPVMASIDVRNIPSTTVTGSAEAVSAFPKSVVAVVPTDGPDLRITVVDTDYGWRVARYEQAG